MKQIRGFFRRTNPIRIITMAKMSSTQRDEQEDHTPTFQIVGYSLCACHLFFQYRGYIIIKLLVSMSRAYVCV